jgi:hypothetical protein
MATSLHLCVFNLFVYFHQACEIELLLFLPFSTQAYDMRMS